MKLNLIKLAQSTHTWISTFIYDVMTQHTPNADKWSKVFNFNMKEGDIEVRVLVNGVEVSFESFMETLEDNHESMLEEKARELLKDNFGNVISTLEKMSEDAVQKLEYDVLPEWKKIHLKVRVNKMSKGPVFPNDYTFRGIFYGPHQANRQAELAIKEGHENVFVELPAYYFRRNVEFQTHENMGFFVGWA